MAEATSSLGILDQEIKHLSIDTSLQLEPTHVFQEVQDSLFQKVRYFSYVPAVCAVWDPIDFIEEVAF